MFPNQAVVQNIKMNCLFFKFIMTVVDILYHVLETVLQNVDTEKQSMWL